MRNKKILFIVDEFFPISSAPASRINSFLKYKPQNADAYVLCGSSYSETPHEQKIKKVKYYTVKRPDEKKLIKFLLFLVRFRIKSFMLRKFKKWDMIVMTVPKYEILPLRFFGLKDDKFVLDIRDIIESYNYEAYLKRFSKRLVFLNSGISKFIKWLLKTNINSSKKTIIAYDGIYDWIVKMCPNAKNKIFKVYNGVDFDIFPELPAKKEGNLTLIYAGNFAEKDLIFPIFEAIKDSNKAIEMILLGDGRNKDKAIEYAKKIGIFHRLSFIGRVPQERVYEIINKADIGIILRNPSFPTLNPLIVLEFMAMNLPVIVNDYAEPADFIKKNKAGFVIKNIKELTDLLIKLSNNRKLFKKSTNRKKILKFGSRRDIANKFYEVIGL